MQIIEDRGKSNKNFYQILPNLGLDFVCYAAFILFIVLGTGEIYCWNMTVFVFYSKQKVWKSNIPHLFAELTNFHPYQRWLKHKNISSKLFIFKFPIYEISIPQYIH